MNSILTDMIKPMSPTWLRNSSRAVSLRTRIPKVEVDLYYGNCHQQLERPTLLRSKLDGISTEEKRVSLNWTPNFVSHARFSEQKLLLW